MKIYNTKSVLKALGLGSLLLFSVNTNAVDSTQVIPVTGSKAQIAVPKVALSPNVQINDANCYWNLKPVQFEGGPQGYTTVFHGCFGPGGCNLANHPKNEPADNYPITCDPGYVMMGMRFQNNTINSGSWGGISYADSFANIYCCKLSYEWIQV